MNAYLKRAHEHEQFMKVQQRDFELGKRHLANMMGENPDTLTQEAIDVTINWNLKFANLIKDPYRKQLSICFLVDYMRKRLVP